MRSLEEQQAHRTALEQDRSKRLSESAEDTDRYTATVAAMKASGEARQRKAEAISRSREITAKAEIGMQRDSISRLA